MPCLPQCSEDSGDGDEASSRFSTEEDGTKLEFCLQPGKPSCSGSKTEASDLGGKVKRVIFGKADGTFCIRECKMGDVVAILMKEARRLLANSAPGSIRTWGQGFMKKACDVSLALYWPGYIYQSSPRI